MIKNWCYKITEGEHAGKTLWSGRYRAVAAFAFCKIHGVWHVLANQRGEGTPRFPRLLELSLRLLRYGKSRGSLFS
nr:MAG TPA: SORL reductase-like protein [Caudoviricetes sp.]